MNLKEALKQGKLEEFIAEREGRPPGDPAKAEAVIRRMAGTSPTAPPSSPQDASGGCSDTQTPQRTSEGAFPRRGRASRGSSS
jgi:hypothetical protein